MNDCEVLEFSLDRVYTQEEEEDTCTLLSYVSGVVVGDDNYEKYEDVQ